MSEECKKYSFSGNKTKKETITFIVDKRGVKKRKTHSLEKKMRFLKTRTSMNKFSILYFMLPFFGL